MNLENSVFIEGDFLNFEEFHKYMFPKRKKRVRREELFSSLQENHNEDDREKGGITTLSNLNSNSNPKANLILTSRRDSLDSAQSLDAMELGEVDEPITLPPNYKPPTPTSSLSSSGVSPSSSSSQTDPDSDLFNNNNNNFENQYRNNRVGSSVHKALGHSIMDLRNIHTISQRRRANTRKTYDSDSDSESDLEETIRKLAERDTTWFHGCGFKITLDTSIFFSQFTIAIIGLIFCIIKLASSDSCDVTQIYAPIFTAILGYFFASPLKEFHKKNNSDKKNNVSCRKY